MNTSNPGSKHMFLLNGKFLSNEAKPMSSWIKTTWLPCCVALVVYAPRIIAVPRKARETFQSISYGQEERSPCFCGGPRAF